MFDHLATTPETSKGRLFRRMTRIIIEVPMKETDQELFTQVHFVN